MMTNWDIVYVHFKYWLVSKNMSRKALIRRSYALQKAFEKPSHRQE